MVIIIDGGTVSSGEVLTVALRDAHRATLIGEKTAGALGGANIVPLPVGGMEVTVEEVDGPQYEQVEGVGISPDREVPLSAEDVSQGTDTQRNAALQAVGAERLPVLGRRHTGLAVETAFFLH
jgi:carboxyl-terminal processing protease